MALIVIFPGFFFNGNRQPALALSLDILGFFLIILGQIFRASARGYKAEFSGEGTKLIKTGPYDFVRNPMYLGILLIGSGSVLILFKIWALALFLVIFLFRYVFLAFQEEARLKSIFTEEYRSYLQKVPRLIPSVGSVARKEIAQFLPLKALWLKRELGTIAALLAGVLILAFWKDWGRQNVIYVFNAFILTGLFFWAVIIYLLKRTKKNGAAGL